MSCEEALEFIRKIQNAEMIDAEAEKDLRDLGFTIPIAVSIVRQINDYVAYHTSMGADPDIWNTNNEESGPNEDPDPLGNQRGGRRSRKGKKQRRRTRRRN